MTAAPRRVGELLAEADLRLRAVSDSPHLDAELLLGHVLGLDRAALRARDDDAAGPEAVARFEALLQRREAGEPVAYLTGRRGFWSLDLEVGPGVLVPRPETELLVEAALARLAGLVAPAVLDLGTGSGAVALAIALERPDAEVTAVDASAAALRVARRNARAAGLDRVRLVQGHWFEPLAGQRFDAIVANPPYLSSSDPHLAALPCEPRTALVAGPNGLEALIEIATAAPRFLRPGAPLLLEHGAEQGAAVRALCAAAGLGPAATLSDLAGHERVTVARAPVE